MPFLDKRRDVSTDLSLERLWIHPPISPGLHSTASAAYSIPTNSIGKIELKHSSRGGLRTLVSIKIFGLNPNSPGAAILQIAFPDFEYATPSDDLCDITTFVDVHRVISTIVSDSAVVYEVEGGTHAAHVPKPPGNLVTRN
jgi:hypothetical protein